MDSIDRLAEPDPASQKKVLSQKTVYKAKLFNVVETEFELPNKKRKLWQIAERRPTVLVFPITDYYKLCLVQQYRYMLDRVTFEAVAGFVEDDELPIKAAKRELEEETGIKASQFEELIKIEMAASVFRSRAILYLAKDLQLGQRKLEGEEIKLVKLSITEALGKVVSHEICDSGTIIGIFLLNKLRREQKL